MAPSNGAASGEATARGTVGRLHGRVRDYAWGSRTALAAMRGASTPSDRPEAEVWFGAHPAAPALLERDGATRPLDEVIATDVAREIGADVAASYDARLPFLVKILAAARPLSIQVHPTAAQAQQGFAAEERRGIALDAPERNYRDTWPKPELLLALTRVEMFCGLREHAVLVDMLDQVGIDTLDPLAERIRRDGDRALPGVVADILGWPAGVAADVITRLIDALVHTPDRDRVLGGTREEIPRLATDYPADPGVVVALLLRRLSLEPETSIALPAGSLHAYVRGVGVEVMATSDNVVRGGLTHKHVDVDELVKLVDPAARPIPQAGDILGDGLRRHAGDTGHFVLQRLVPPASRVTHAGSIDCRPEVIVCTAGSVELVVDGERVRLAAGDAAFVSAAARDLRIAGEGDLVRVTVGESSTGS